jgi:serine/threonine protein kinase
MNTPAVGTYKYSAPELFRPSDPQDPNMCIKYKKSIDIYSLTLVIHLIYGGNSDFFPGLDTDLHLFFAKMKGQEPNLVLDLVDSSLKELISRGISADPERRPALEEFAQAISSLP